MNRSIIRKIAKQNGVSTAEVRREMQAAIDATYINPTAAALAVPRADSVPTPEELIDHCARMVTPRLSAGRMPN